MGLVFTGLVSPALAQKPAAEAFAQATAGFERREGLLPIYLDRKAGKVFLAL